MLFFINKLINTLPLVLGILGSVVGQILLARSTGSELFGKYNLFLAWINFATVFAVAGFPYAAAKVLPPLNHTGATTALRYAIVYIVLNLIGLAVLASAILLLLVALVPFGIAPAGIWQFALGFALIPLLALSQVRVAICSALKHLWLGQLPDNILRPLLIGGTAFYLSWIHAALSVNVLVVLTIGIYSLATMVGGALLWNALPSAKPEAFDGAQIRKSIRGVAIYLGGTNVVIGIAKNMDIAIVGAQVSPKQLGIYIAATRIADFVSIIYTLLDPIHFPKFSIAHQTSSRTVLVDEIRSYQFLAISWSIICVLVYAFAGPFLLSWFGSEFKSGWNTLLLLGLALSVNAWTGPGGQLLTLLGFEKQTFMSSVICIILYLALLIPMVYYWNTTGAALCVLIYQLTRGLWQALLVHKYLGLVLLPPNPFLQISKLWAE